MSKLADTISTAANLLDFAHCHDSPSAHSHLMSLSLLLEVDFVKLQAKRKCPVLTCSAELSAYRTHLPHRAGCSLLAINLDMIRSLYGVISFLGIGSFI